MAGEVHTRLPRTKQQRQGFMVKAHESLMDRILKMFNRITDLIALRGLTIRWRFTSFFFGTSFWFVVIAAIGIATILTESAYYKKIGAIATHDKVGQKIIRKLRGVSISAHQIVASEEIQIISQHAEKGKLRLNDITTFINTALKGGVLRDYSRSIERLFDGFLVEPVRGERERYLIKAMGKIDKLRETIDKLVEVKVNDRTGSAKNSMALERLKEIDAIILDAEVIMGSFFSANTKLINDNEDKINKLHYVSAMAFSLSLLIASSLLLIFLVKLSRSMTNPIKTMTGYIQDISDGGIIVSQESAKMRGKDELGELFHQFEDLVEWFTEINFFKKVIEEDYTVEDVYTRFADVFKRHAGIGNFLIYEISNNKNSMHVAYPQESIGEEVYCNRNIQVDCNLCRAKKTGHIVSSLKYSDICRQFFCNGGKGHICVPLIMEGSPGGVIQFVFDAQEEGFNPEEVEKRVSKARQYIDAAIPVIAAKRLQLALKESSLRDALTGLHNRRFLEEYVENLVSGVLRKKTLLGLLMCDVDFFKEVNDVHGHDIGDIVLRETSNIIKRSVRGSDIVVRFGGEEFLIILMDVREEEAQRVAEKIRSQMEDTKVRIGGGFIQKTISIGISEFPKDTEQFWEAIKFSDVALYKGKQTGRNKVVRFTQEMWVEGKY